MLSVLLDEERSPGSNGSCAGEDAWFLTNKLASEFITGRCLIGKLSGFPSGRKGSGCQSPAPEQRNSSGLCPVFNTTPTSSIESEYSI